MLEERDVPDLLLERPGPEVPRGRVRVSVRPVAEVLASPAVERRAEAPPAHLGQDAAPRVDDQRAVAMAGVAGGEADHPTVHLGDQHVAPVPTLENSPTPPRGTRPSRPRRYRRRAAPRR